MTMRLHSDGRAGRDARPKRATLPAVALSALLATGSGAALGAPRAAGAALAPRSAATAAPVRFVPIREPWDGGRVARHRDASIVCANPVRTPDDEIPCFHTTTENTDVRIDGLRRAAFGRATTVAAERAVNLDDARWLADRASVVRLSYPVEPGDAFVGVALAYRAQAVSAARLAGLRGGQLPTADLVATDTTNPDATEYATTVGGTLVGAVDVEGDGVGGVVIDWDVIAGYHGFSVAPTAFTYADGTFVDRGVVGAHVAGHRIAPATRYDFQVDYRGLAADPHASAGTGRWQYRLRGHLVGSWS